MLSLTPACSIVLELTLTPGFVLQEGCGYYQASLTTNSETALDLVGPEHAYLLFTFQSERAYVSGRCARNAKIRYLCLLLVTP